MENLYIRSVVRETWLSKKPEPQAFIIAAMMTLLLALASSLYWNNPIFTHAMPASQLSVYGDHHFWQAWSALFAHADQKHLLSNSFLFFILGSMLGGYFGLFMFPLMAFIFGGITELIVLSGMNPETQLIGASGIVFWMGGAWLALYFLLDIKRSYYQRALRATGVALVVFFPAEAFDPQVSYLSHFVGFGLGLIWGLIYYVICRKKFIKSIVRETILEEDFAPEPVVIN